LGFSFKECLRYKNEEQTRGRWRMYRKIFPDHLQGKESKDIFYKRRSVMLRGIKLFIRVKVSGNFTLRRINLSWRIGLFIIHRKLIILSLYDTTSLYIEGIHLVIIEPHLELNVKSWMQGFLSSGKRVTSK
jgi:hypothetical protein